MKFLQLERMILQFALLKNPSQLRHLFHRIFRRVKIAGLTFPTPQIAAMDTLLLIAQIAVRAIPSSKIFHMIVRKHPCGISLCVRNVNLSMIIPPIVDFMLNQMPVRCVALTLNCGKMPNPKCSVMTLLPKPPSY